MAGGTGLNKVRQLTKEALDAFERTPLSVTVLTCQRVAHLRGDWQSLTWLEMETHEFGGPKPAAEGLSRALMLEIAGPEATNADRLPIVEKWMDRRRISEDDDNIAAHSLDQMEALTALYDQELVNMASLAGDSEYTQGDKASARQKLNESLQLIRATYAKSRVALWQYLLRTERELDYLEVNQEIFDRTKSLVDRRLAELAPEALQRFNGAFRAMREEDGESRSQAATSCRRVLGAVADLVCPPRRDPVIDPGGTPRSLTADKHVNRLLWFVQEASSSQTAGNLTSSNLTDLAARLDAMERLSGKGVHAVPEVEEIEMLAIQTYLLVGEILRLFEDCGAV